MSPLIFAQVVWCAVTALGQDGGAGQACLESVPQAGGKGNGYVRGIETLLACAGSPVSYDRLMGLSGIAFIAQADTEHVWEGTVDVGWWPLDPWGLALRREFLGQAVGRRLREIGRLTLTPDEFLAVRDRLPQVYRESIEPEVKRAIDGGQPLLATCDFGFLITGYDSSGDAPPVLGRCACDTEREGYRCGSWPIGLIALGEPTEQLDPDAADVAALRYAVALGQDRAGPYEATRRDRRFTGQKAFAAWAALLRDASKSVEDRHHANMIGNLIWNRSAAVAYLREVAGRRPGGAADALSQATAAYEAVLDRLSRMRTDNLAGSPEARRRLADQVDAVAALESEAVGHIEEALTHMTVQRDGEKVVIEGVKVFDTGRHGSSVHGAQDAILRTLGEPLSYDDLICYGGLAFRVQVHEAMCPSAAHPCCGFECVQQSNRALPWRTTLFERFPWTEGKREGAASDAQICAAIKQSIDRGIPVHYGSEEDGIIIGYADEGRRWLCLHPYHDAGKTAFWHDEVKGFAGGNWPWGIAVWTEPKPAEDRVPAGELLRAALEQAVAMWKTPKSGDYYVGEAAYEHWLGWLRDVEAGRCEDPKGGMQGNGWCYDTLIQYRRVAARWLQQAARDCAPEAREQLLRAADHYAAIAELCMEGLQCSWDFALPPQRYDEWTSAVRQDQIRRLEAALEHDRAAISGIEAALGGCVPVL